MEKSLKEMTEKELSNYKVETPKSLEDLNNLINDLSTRSHSYGSAVYAMSIAAFATLEFMASELGVTGFQYSCADLDIIKRTRHLKYGFALLDYKNVLYPQYCNREHFPDWTDILKKNSDFFSAEAKKLLEETPNAHPDVLEHWRKIIEMCEENS